MQVSNSSPSDNLTILTVHLLTRLNWSFHKPAEWLYGSGVFSIVLNRKNYYFSVFTERKSIHNSWNYTKKRSLLSNRSSTLTWTAIICVQNKAECSLGGVVHEFHERCHSVTSNFIKKDYFLILAGSAFYQVWLGQLTTTSKCPNYIW